MSHNEMIIDVRVITRASCNEIVGTQGGVLRVRITAPPVDGAANTELVKLLSRAFGVSRSNVEIVSGETSRNKRLRITGASEAVIQQVLKA